MTVQNLAAMSGIEGSARRTRKDTGEKATPANLCYILNWKPPILSRQRSRVRVSSSPPYFSLVLVLSGVPPHMLRTLRELTTAAYDLAVFDVV